jgi:hypothetical protein
MWHSRAKKLGIPLDALVLKKRNSDRFTAHNGQRPSGTRLVVRLSSASQRMSSAHGQRAMRITHKRKKRGTVTRNYSRRVCSVSKGSVALFVGDKTHLSDVGLS